MLAEDQQPLTEKSVQESHDSVKVEASIEQACHDVSVPVRPLPGRGKTMEAGEVHERVVDRLRDDQARAPKTAEWTQMERELATAGIDTSDLGIFSSAVPTSFDYEAAAPILVRWLPRVRDSVEKEVIVRSLTGVKTATSAAARAIVAEFRSADVEAVSQKWAYGNALATLADAEIADDLLELASDRRHGHARQMLCDALKRTKDPRAPELLIELIDDDDVSGHATLALRSYGPKSALPHLRQARPKLEAVLARPTASAFAKQQARRALSDWAINGNDVCGRSPPPAVIP